MVRALVLSLLLFLCQDGSYLLEFVWMWIVDASMAIVVVDASMAAVSSMARSLNVVCCMLL